MKKKKVSLVIPFYNDSGCPKPFAQELSNEFEKKKIDYELILVDDCSTDSTPEELDELKSIKIKVIHNKVNKDYGGAIMTGFREAKGDILGFSCGDGEVSAEDIVKIYENLRDWDVIKANRVSRKDGLIRKITSKVFNLWSKLRFGIKMTDINGYPVYFKKEIYKDMDNFNGIKEDWLFNIDFFRKFISRKYKIKEYVVEHKKRFKGESKMIPKRIIKMIKGYILYK
jgi:dolichol-phosphate mannosyltransferase